MHEYSLISSLLVEVERQAQRHGARAVVRVEVEVGALSGVEVELLTTAYETCRPGTLCEGAMLVVHRPKAQWACPSCGGAIAEGAYLQCSACGLPAHLSRGQELILSRLELELEDDPPSSRTQDIEELTHV